MSAPGYATSVDPREGPFAFDDFHGLRNNVGGTSFGTGDLSVALNVDIDDALNIRRRRGFSAAVSAAVDRSLWSRGSVCLGVGGDALKQINPDYTVTTLRSGLAPSRPLSYTAIGDRVFWSNGVDTGVVQGGACRTWGMAVPSIPAATLVGGTLASGAYQYAVTYLRSDGQESGAPRAGTITLDAASGVALSGISVSADPGVSYKAVYLSAPNGATLFAAGLIPNADTTFTISTMPVQASPLLTQFLGPAPAGDFVTEFRGRVIIASGARLYPSEPYAPELFDLRKSIPLDDVVTMLAGMPDGSGVYVGMQTQVAWVQGNDPAAWDYRVVAQYGAIPGTLSWGDGALMGDGGASEQIAFFATQRGLCAGRSGGALVNLTEARFAYPSQPRGAGVVRRHRGMAQYLCTMKGPETAGSVAV